MINEPPIFLGGQGGIVGPIRIAYGTVVAAGTVVRKEILKENTILLGYATYSKTMPYHQGLYANIKKIVSLNTIYISNLIALRRWYVDVRSRFMKYGPLERALLEGALEKLDEAIAERLRRLGQVANQMPRSIETWRKLTSTSVANGTVQKKQEFFERWPDMEQVFKDSLHHEGNPSQRDAFLSIVEKATNQRGKSYLGVVKGFDKTEAVLGTTWLQGLVNEISGSIWKMLPTLGIIKG
jgi:UDP-N-acetylglucosamine/UDP-N-acetylgalactosamine diphosphorylase